MKGGGYEGVDIFTARVLCIVYVFENGGVMTEEKKPRFGLYVDDEYYGVIEMDMLLQSIKEQLIVNMGDGDICDVRIKRIDMTDAEYDSMPEANI